MSQVSPPQSSIFTFPPEKLSLDPSRVEQTSVKALSHLPSFLQLNYFFLSFKQFLYLTPPPSLSHSKS